MTNSFWLVYFCFLLLIKISLRLCPSRAPGLFRKAAGAKSLFLMSRLRCQMLCSRPGRRAFSANNPGMDLTTLNAHHHPLLHRWRDRARWYMAVASLLGPFVNWNFLFWMRLSFKVSNVTPQHPCHFITPFDSTWFGKTALWDFAPDSLFDGGRESLTC